MVFSLDEFTMNRGVVLASCLLPPCRHALEHEDLLAGEKTGFSAIPRHSFELAQPATACMCASAIERGTLAKEHFLMSEDYETIDALPCKSMVAYVCICPASGLVTGTHGQL